MGKQISRFEQGVSGLILKNQQFEETAVMFFSLFVALDNTLNDTLNNILNNNVF